MSNENENPENELSKIDAIKDIIFGADKKQMENSIGSLEAKVDKELDKLENRLVRVIEKLEANILDKIDKSEENTRKELEKLNETKTDRKKLGAMLMKLGESLQK